MPQSRPNPGPGRYLVAKGDISEPGLLLILDGVEDTIVARSSDILADLLFELVRLANLGYQADKDQPAAPNLEILAAREPITHRLKAWPAYFWEIESGAKQYELRKNDRDYRKDDRVTIEEWDPDLEDYTGRSGRYVISSILYAGDMPGLEPGYCVFSLIVAAE